jgi:hypothetical protein
MRWWPTPGTDERIVQITTLVLIVGFPMIVLLSSANEITPHGLKPTADVDRTQSVTANTGRRLNYILLALLALATATLILEYLA